MLPEQVGDQPVDLAAYYDQHHQWFFGFLLVTLVVSVIKDVIINGSLPGPVNLGFHLFLAAASVSALLIRGRRYQECVGVASAGAFVAHVALLLTRLR
ncbi:MAG: hypothetical protein DMF76_25245 [Acidobacteria bacterium]|nr:MAG: hypothetical protein DMF76_25245 [Acidobacteriota bacterium]